MPGILIVDDHAVVRRSVRSLLACHSLEVCGEAADGREGIQKLRELLPDVVLLDIEMPVMGGIEAAPEMLRIRPSVKILFLTMHYHASFAKRVAACSHGFLNKVDAGTQLVPAVRRLLEAEAPQAPEAPAPPSHALRYAWQQTVADALAAPGGSLPGKINVAERAILVRLTSANELDEEEHLALKEALRTLRQLIAETRDQLPKEDGREEQGVA